MGGNLRSQMNAWLHAREYIVNTSLLETETKNLLEHVNSAGV